VRVAPAEEQRAREAGPQRRDALRAVLGPLLSAVLMVVLYYVLPMDRKFDGGTVLLLVLGLLGVCALVALQVLRIARSDYPRLQAVGALALSIPLFLLIFATTYFLLSQGDPKAFTEPLNRTDALYYTITVFATVGFGDIAPTTQTARVLAMVQMLGDLVLLGLTVRVLMRAVSVGLERRGDTEPPER
jgi:hypothetical protein